MKSTPGGTSALQTAVISSNDTTSDWSIRTPSGMSCGHADPSAWVASSGWRTRLRPPMDIGGVEGPAERTWAGRVLLLGTCLVRWGRPALPLPHEHS